MITSRLRSWLRARVASLFTPAVLGLAVLSSAAHAQSVSTFASGMSNVASLSLDPVTNTYTAGSLSYTVYRVTQAGASSVLVSTGGAGAWEFNASDYSGNVYMTTFTGNSIMKRPSFGGSPATLTTAITQPTGLVYDPSAGVFYVASYGGNSIYKMTTTGAVTLFASSVIQGGSANGVGPMALTRDSAGNLYVSGSGTNVGSLFKVSPAGVSTPVATNLKFSPLGIVLSRDGSIYLTGGSSGTIQRLTPAGTMSTFVAGLSQPFGILEDANGNFLVGSGTTVAKVTRGSLSVNFTGGGTNLAAADQPGICSGPNWNNVAGNSGSSIALQDATLGATSARLTFSSAAASAAFTGTATTPASTNTLYKGGLSGATGSEVNVTISNIPYACYDVYVYADGDSTSTNTLQLTDGTTNYYYRSTGARDSTASTLTQTTSTDSANPTAAAGQYQVFTNLSSPTFTLTTGGSVTGVISNNIYGLQIVARPLPAPTLTSATVASAQTGTTFTYQITGTNSPTSFGATGLPTGLSLNTTTGVISGNPTVTGTYNIGLSAVNGTGTGFATLTLSVKALQTLTVYGTTTAAGAIDPNTDCSRDGGATWLPAYAANVAHPWGNISGTTAWISRVASMTSDPATSDSHPETLDFRIRFYAPSDISNAQLTYSINPDNLGDIYLNGTKLNSTQIVGGGITSATITNANIVGGLNTIIVRLTDTGGLLGINYRIDMQGIGGSAFQRLTAPPAVTNITSTTANGSYKAGVTIPVRVTFTNAVTVTGTPTLALAAGTTRNATYASGSGTTTLTFNYVVQAGDTATALDYTSTSALSGGSIISSAADAQAANLTLPSPGTSGSLSANKTLAIDTIAPTLTVPANMTVEAPSASGVTVNYSVTATDNVGTPTVTYSRASGATFGVGSTTVVVTATDAAGNATSKSFAIAVRCLTLTADQTVLTVPEGGTATNKGTFGEMTGASVTLSQSLAGASLTQNGINWSWSYTAPFGAVGSSTVTLTVSDDLGTKTLPFTLNVTDGTRPRVASIVRQSPTTSPTAQDTVTFRVTFSEPVTGVSPASFVVSGTTATASVATVNSSTYDVTLAGGDLATLNGTVTLSFPAMQSIQDLAGNALADTTPTGANVNTFVILNNSAPTDIALSNVTIHQTAAIASATIGTLTTTDPDAGDTAAYTLVTGGMDNASFTLSGATLKVGGTALGAGTYAVRVRTTDSGGLFFEKTFTLTVADDVPPVITVPTAPIVAEATGAGGAAVSFTVSATDARDGAVLATPSVASGSTFPLGDTVVTVTASDRAGNAATKSFTVTVRDTTAPQISVSLPALPVLDEKFNGYTGGNPNGTQYLSGLPVQYGGNLPGWTKSGFVNAVHAVNLNGAGNWAVMFYAPDVLTLTNGVAANTAGTTYGVSFLGGPAVYQDPSQATGANDGLVIDILRADDSVLQSFTYKPGAYAGASTMAPASFAYTGDGTGAVRVRIHALDANSGRFGGVIDNLEIAATTATGTVADVTVEATSPAGAVVNYDAVAYDLVDGIVPVTSSAPSGGTFVIGTTPVTLTTVDAAGNASTAQFNVIVVDTIKPSLVVPANVTVTATSAAGATVDFTATTADTASTPALTYSQNPGTVFPLGVTTVNVVATDGSGNAQTGSFTVTVNPALATITLTTPAYSFDGTAKVATATTSPDGLPVTFVYDGGSSSAPVNAGQHTVAASVSLPWISGSATGSFSIAPAALSVAATPATKVYGSADPALAFTLTDGALVAGDAFNGALVRGAGENVGTYAIAQGSLTAGPNYTLTFAAANLVITPKPASVTASPATKVYGSADPVFTGTLAGFLAADNVTATFSRTAGENVAGSPYAIAGTLAANPTLTNYAITSSPAAFSITPAPLTIVATAQTKLYGAADPTLTYAVNGLQFSDTAATVLSGALSRGAGEAVLGSPYAIQRGTLAANSNYTLSYTGAVLTIQPATAAIAVNGYTGVYNGQPHGATGTATGVANANLASLLNLGASFTNVPGGTANWSFHDPAGNYVDASGSVAITLTKAAAVIAVAPYTVSYDGAAHTATGTAQGVSGEALAGLSLAGTTHTNAGSYSDTWTFTDATGNYANATGTVTDSIAKAAATIAVTPYTVVYDGAAHTATGTARGVKGETLAGLSLTGTTHTNAGNYSDTWTFTDATGNYTNASGSVADVINPAPATLALAPLAQMYDGTPRTVIATTALSGLTVTITYNGSTTAPTLPGSYSVVATITAPNYSGTQSGTLTVGVTALVRRGLTINGDIDGSVQVLQPENSTFNGNSGISGDLLVPGTPTVQLNGRPTFGGIKDGTGAATPTNYTVTLNGNALLRYLVRRTNAVTMATVAAPAQPTGTRNVALNKATDPIGAWATLKDLTLNGNVGKVTVPEGVYGSFVANGGSGFTLGVAGATTPSVYQFQSLTLNGNTTFNIVGPVIVILKNDLNVNGIAGTSEHPEWLDLRIANGSLTLNGNVTFSGYVTAPSGTVTINGNSTLTGGLAADKLVINGNGVLIEP